MPRTPALFERKVAWRLDYQEMKGEAVSCDNYVTARDHPEALLKQFEEDVAEGMMVRMSEHAARAEWKENLCIASLGALRKSLEPGCEEYRIVHDGTNAVAVNNAIRTRDQLRMPTHLEGKAALFHMSAEGGTHFALAVDIRKAHRRVPIRRADWGYQTCKIRTADDFVFVNCVGTFGIASIG